jgi:hypothetical protein
MWSGRESTDTTSAPESQAAQVVVPSTTEPSVVQEDATVPAGEDKKPTDTDTPPVSSADPDESSSSPPAEQEKVEPAPPEDTAGSLAVTESGVGTEVVDRQLAGRSDRFQEGTRVWFWTRVVKGEKGDMLRHIWLYEDRPVKIAELGVGGSHWRTYSNFDLSRGSVGRWAVEARDAHGRILARHEFACLPLSPLETYR